MDPDDPDDRLGELLEAGDRAIAAGGEPPGGDSVPPELRGVFGELIDCLRLLDRDAAASRDAATPGAGASDTLTVALPERVGRFRVVRELGRGGFGVVFLAADPALGREVAVKVPRPECLLDPELRRRFAREARAVAALNHPNVVPVHEAVVEGPVCYIVSAYCPGGTLAQWLRSRPEPVPERGAAEIAAALADGVQHAHAQGVLHRDIKPGNVLLEPAAGTTGGLGFVPRLADFGLARLLGPEAESGGATRSGMGTPQYMAPEQASGGAVGPAADVYALGVVLYELLTGRTPFAGSSAADALLRLLRDDPPPPGRLRKGLSRDLEAVCLRCLEKNPSRRYASAAALADDLRRFLGGRPTAVRPLGPMGRAARWVRRRPAALGAFLVVALAVAAGMLAQPEPQAPQVVERQLPPPTPEPPPLTRLEYEADLRKAVGLIDAGETDAARALLDRYAGAEGDGLRSFDWGHLRWRADHVLSYWPIHTQAVEDIAVTPDGRTAASAGWDGLVQAWDLGTGKPRLSFRNQPWPPRAVAMAPDGSHFAIVWSPGSEGVRLQVWKTASRSLLVNGVPEPDPGVMPTAAAFVKEGLLAVATHKTSSLATGESQLWDTSSCKVVNRLRAGEAGDGLYSVDASPDGKLVAAGGASNRVWVWEADSGRLLHSLEGPTGVPTAVAFSTGGRSLAACTGMVYDQRTGQITPNNDHRVWVWDVPTGKLARVLHSPAAGLESVAWSPDRRWLAATTREQRVVVWDAGSWSVAGVSPPTGSEGTRAIKFTPDGDAVLFGMKDGRVGRMALPWHVPGPPGVREVWGLAFSPDGKQLAVADDDESNRGRTVFVFGGEGWQKRLWLVNGHAATATRAKFAQGGSTLVTASLDGTVKFWEAATGKTTRTVATGIEKGVRKLAVSPDGGTIAAAGKGWGIRLWDAATGEPRGVLPHEGMTELAFHPSGRVLAASHFQGLVTRWDWATGTELPWFTVEGSPTCLAYRPDGAVLAVGTRAGHLHLLDANSGRKLWSSRPGPEVTAVAFSPDGRSLVTGDLDGGVRLWPASELADPAAKAPEPFAFRGHRAKVNAIAFTPDGRAMATADHSGRILVWPAAGR